MALVVQAKQQNPQPAAAAAIPAVGRGHQNPLPAAAAAIPAVGRGHQIPQPAAAAAIPAVGRGHQNPQPAAAAASPVRRDHHVQPYMSVLKDLFDFVTGVLRSGVTIRNFPTVAGYTTTYEIQGDEFVACYNSTRNYVADNKREAGALFLNHLIDVGAVVMNGPMITTGPRFLRYVEYLDLGRWGHYNVHNARFGVEHHLGVGNFTFLQTGEPGRYICTLHFPIYGPNPIRVHHLAETKK